MKTSPATPLRLEQSAAGAVFWSPNMTNMHMRFRPFSGGLEIPPINVPAWKTAQAALPEAEQRRDYVSCWRGAQTVCLITTSSGTGTLFEPFCIKSNQIGHGPGDWRVISVAWVLCRNSTPPPQKKRNIYIYINTCISRYMSISERQRQHWSIYVSLG